MKSLIIGAGTYGEVYLSYLREQNINIVGFIDDDASLHGNQILGVDVLGGKDVLQYLFETGIAEAVYCPIGNNEVRVSFLTYAKAIGYNIPSFIHPTAIVAKDVFIGEGVYILPGSIIMPYVKLYDYVMISIGSNIIHHTCLNKGVFVSNGVNLGANITVKSNVFVGMGATIMTGVKTIGEKALIGAGAVVIKDVDDKAIVAGNPARLIRYKD